MNLRTFIERPVFSAVISITIVILGIIGLFTLPVEQYPDIAPPTVMVSTTYYGANAETLQKSVIAPLEEAINGVEDMTYMTSSATNNGTVTITIYFRQGVDPDMAAVNVQNKVSEATGLLPSEVTQVGVTVRKRQTSQLAIIGVYSPDDRFDDHQCGGENLDGDLDPPDRANGRPPGSGCPGANPCRPSADGPQPAGVHPPISPPAGRRIRTMHIAFTRRDCIPLRLSINQYVCEAIPHPHGDATQAIPGHPPAGRLPATLSVGLTRRADCLSTRWQGIRFCVSLQHENV